MKQPPTTLTVGCWMCGALLLPLPCLAAPPTTEPERQIVEGDPEPTREQRNESKAAMTLQVRFAALDARSLPTASLASLESPRFETEHEAVEDREADEAAEPRDTSERLEPKKTAGLDVGGSIAIGLGIAALVWGGVELSRGVIVEGTGREQQVRVDHRSAGNALLAVGAAAFVTGAVLLAIDWDQDARKRKKRWGGPAHFYPVFGTDGVGLGVSARF